MSSSLGFVAKDNTLSNVKVQESLVAKTLAAQTVSTETLSTDTLFADTATITHLNGNMSGNINGTSILLPTTGGIPTPLTYYEEFAGVATFTSTAFTGMQTATMNITRVGKAVSLTLQPFTVTANGSAGGYIIAAAGTVPSRFLFTLATLPGVFGLFNAFSNGTSLGFIRIANDGSITLGLYNTTGFPGFPNVGTIGFDATFMPAPATLAWSLT